METHVTSTDLSQITMRELVFAEETLLALYDKHLPAIRARSGGPAMATATAVR